MDIIVTFEDGKNICIKDVEVKECDINITREQSCQYDEETSVETLYMNIEGFIFGFDPFSIDKIFDSKISKIMKFDDSKETTLFDMEIVDGVRFNITEVLDSGATVNVQIYATK